MEWGVRRLLGRWVLWKMRSGCSDLVPYNGNHAEQ